MAIIPAYGGERLPNTARLSAAQAGNGVSAHSAARGAATVRPALPTFAFAGLFAFGGCLDRRTGLPSSRSSRAGHPRSRSGRRRYLARPSGANR